MKSFKNKNRKIKKIWLSIKNNRLITNAGAYISGGFIQRAADFLLIPLWAAFLTPEDYAITGTMYAYRGMLLTVLVMGLNSALTRQYFDHQDDPQEQKRYISSVYLFQLLFAGVLIFCMDHWGFSVWLHLTGNKTAFDPFVRLMLWMTFTTASVQIAQAVYQAQQKARQFVTIIYGLFIIRIITMVLLVVIFPMGAYGQLLADVIAGGIVSVLTLIIVAKNWFTLNFSWKYVREGLSFGLPLIPFLLALWVLEGADRMILEQLVSRTELGLYNFGYKVGSAVQYLVMGIFQAFTPYYFRIMLKGENIEKKIKKFFTAFFGITGILSLAGALFAGEIIHILMPESYAGAEIYAIPVLFSGIMLGFYQFASLPLLHYKKTAYFPFFTIIAALVNIGLNLWLVPHFGALASAWITVISYFLLFCMTIFFASKYQKFDYLPVLPTLVLTLLLLGGTVLALKLPLLTAGSILIKLGITFVYGGISYFWLLRPYVKGSSIFDFSD